MATIYVCFLLVLIKKYSNVEFSSILPQFLDLILCFGKSCELCVILILRLTTPTLHQLVSKPRFFFPTMANGGRGGGNKHVHMSEVYKRKEATCDE